MSDRQGYEVDRDVRCFELGILTAAQRDDNLEVRHPDIQMAGVRGSRPP